ncbi:hypothetical protein PSTG_03441 [Puccinia striiformis f. sp. tritici PST-78]|uniref:Uncharacterized protein n=1 Tax=Puccinia striiformis f. sp. tritici PST-78 TaxID=1165861 RepID=A0A0L0VWY9_9BASI|nr:hypothetical protein PSTG_03441 [Puccinia striiformis f. sp. tritici PST-78]
MTRRTPQTRKRNRRKSPSPPASLPEPSNANTQPPASDDVMIDDQTSITQADHPNTSQHSTTGHRELTDQEDCPGKSTSVDVERAFSFGRHYVTQKRHRLNSVSVTRGYPHPLRVLGCHLAILTEEQFGKTSNKASVCDGTVYLTVAKVYAEGDKNKKANATYNQALKKLSASSKAWTLCGEFFLKNSRPKQAQQLLSQCVTVYRSTNIHSLILLFALHANNKHIDVKTIHKFTQLESKFGDHERPRTLFEGSITQKTKAKRYLDLEMQKGTAAKVICGLYS